MSIKIILFYKFVGIENPKKFKEIHLNFCKSLGIKGKVLIANEGINGSVSGTKKQIELYKAELRKDKRFFDIEFKEEFGLYHPFDKIAVKIKKEIIRLDKKVDIKNKGRYISSKEFLELYKNNRDVIILDARNDYEFKAGRFKNAISPEIKTFRQFPEFVDKFLNNKEKNIVMYCTGGIRCEKASAYMVEQGFNKVFQLHGGIINFCQDYPNTIWEGRCFVFDKRITSPIGQKENPLNNCTHCEKPCDLYRNCKNKFCDQLVFICPKCERKMHSCCSKNCMMQILSC